ncbi:MAG: UrcA family protein [Sphingopyxis sp.]|nr:UrcA family protein [Sphingopyxis sp.]
MAKLIPILLAAPIALTGLSLPAAAQDDPSVDKRSVAVRYDDLNLANAAGRERLSARVQSAVRQVCGVRSARDAWERQTASKCKDAAMRDADGKLAALFERNGTAFADAGSLVVATQ